VFPLGGDLLAIYLQDHLAGATGGVELARRAAGENEGTELGRFLARLATEIERDREALEGIMGRLGVGSDRLKNVAAWTGEKVGRLKLNGRILEYSPLSQVMELEGLIIGVNGKLALWRTLRGLAEQVDGLDPVEIDQLIARADGQLDGLREQHGRVAPAALAPQARA
jgi:hypothetical protein